MQSSHFLSVFRSEVFLVGPAVSRHSTGSVPLPFLAETATVTPLIAASTPVSRLEPIVQDLLKSAGRGMQNCGNSCYMASALTSLVHVSSIAQKIWNTNAPPTGAPVSQEKTRKCLEHFFQNGWKIEGKKIDSERDPHLFIEYLYPRLDIAPMTVQSQVVGKDARKIQLNNITLLTRLLTQPTTIQAMLTESSVRNYAFYEDSIPDFLPITLATRASDTMPKNTTELIASLVLEIPLFGQPNKKALFDLVSVVVYLGDRNMNGHYISCVRENRKWVKYDDGRVTVYEDARKIEKLINQHSYLSCYSKRT